MHQQQEEDATLNESTPTQLAEGEDNQGAKGNEGVGASFLDSSYVKSDAYTPTPEPTAKGVEATVKTGMFSFLRQSPQGDKTPDYEKGTKRRVYWDKSGALRFEMIKDIHNAETELKTMLELDTPFITAKEQMYVISTRWLSEWMCFASHGDVTPGPIDNSNLISSKKNTVLKKAIYTKHWRPLNKNVWDYLVSLYGGGPSITVENGEADLGSKEEIEDFMTKLELYKKAKIGANVSTLPTV